MRLSINCDVRVVCNRLCYVFFKRYRLVASVVSTCCVLTNSLVVILFSALLLAARRIFVSPHFFLTMVGLHHRDLLFHSMHTKPIGAPVVSQMHL